MALFFVFQAQLPTVSSGCALYYSSVPFMTETKLQYQAQRLPKATRGKHQRRLGLRWSAELDSHQSDIKGGCPITPKKCSPKWYKRTK